MPPKTTLSGRAHPAHTAWHTPPQGRDYSARGALPVDSPVQKSGGWQEQLERPMQMQAQQQQQHRPQQMLQQRGGRSQA